MSKRELVLIFRIGEPCHLNSVWEIPKFNLTNDKKPKRLLWTPGMLSHASNDWRTSKQFSAGRKGTCLIATVSHFGKEDLSFLFMMLRWCWLNESGDRTKVLTRNDYFLNFEFQVKSENGK